MPKIRTDLGKQVSSIPRPDILEAQNLAFQLPKLKDITSAFTISDNLRVWGGRVQIDQPQITTDLPACQLPLQSEVITIPLIEPLETSEIFQANSIKLNHLTASSLREADLPLRSNVEAIQLDPTSSMELFSFAGEIVETIELQISGNYDLSFAPLSFSANYIEEEKFAPVFVSGPMSLTPLPAISKNLFIPIRIEKILGMSYADRHWKEEEITTTPVSPINANTNPRHQTPPQKVNTGKRGRPSKRDSASRPSFWDLLFVILQPPLTLEQVDNLLLPHSLYPYQVLGIEFLLNNNHALLADEMGTGKTVMTTVALKILLQQAKVRHVLILCPPSVLHEWKRHLDEWAPELTTYFVRGGQGTRELIWDISAHVYVTTYDTLARDLRGGRLPKRMYTHFDVVAIDEAHHIKNVKSKRSRAIKLLKPTRRWALTGTPIQNKLDDLASIFEFVYPNHITTYDLYEERIKEKIRPYFLRRRKKDVMPDLPPKQRQGFYLELDSRQKMAYLQTEKAVQDELSGLGAKVTKQHVFAKLTRLKQICNFAPGSFTSPKVELLKEQVEEIIEGGNKVIIFSQYVEEGIDKLEQVLKPYGIAKIVGGQSDATRWREIERFKFSEQTPILLASIKSGGEGLNLAEASYVIHFDHWWNPAVMWQAEDRVHRRGQIHGVNIYSYWMNGTIDERIHEILTQKGVLIENVVDGDADDLPSAQIEDLISVDEWLEIFGVKQIKIVNKPKSPVKDWQSMSLSEIREQLYELTPRAFEELVKNLMHYWGYPNVKVTGKSGDGGIDVISTRNTENGVERIAAQCKRYRGNVSVGTARDFIGAIKLNRTIVKGFLVTTSDFTPECLHICEISGIVKTVSGFEVARYVKQYGLSI